MGKRFEELNARHIEFIKSQKMFFVGTAGKEGKVNISPKGMDTFRIINKNRIVWLNLTGSGNETAAHVLENKRMTIMFCAFEGNPLILRLYGNSIVIHQRDDSWKELVELFPPIAGARQIYDLTIDTVQTSCGTGVPLYDYNEDRDQLIKWAENQKEEGIKNYWEIKNKISIDGKPTNIILD